jgi:hypothetical protein
MAAPAPGRRPGHIQLEDFEITLEPGDSRHPFRPVVHGLRLRISAEGLRQLAQALVDEADKRAPVGLKLVNARVGPQGLDLYLRVAKGIFGSDLSTRISLSAPGGEMLRAELTDTDMPAWMPLDVLLEQAVKRGGAAVARDPDNRRALLLDPAALLALLGVPGRFAPGRWDVATSGEGIDLSFVAQSDDVL